jgi:hypothetical protein
VCMCLSFVCFVLVGVFGVALAWFVSSARYRACSQFAVAVLCCDV